MPQRDMLRVVPLEKAVQQKAPFVPITSKKKRINKQAPIEKVQDVDEQVSNRKIKQKSTRGCKEGKFKPTEGD